MNGATRRTVKTAALIASAVSVFFLVALFVPIPAAVGVSSYLANNALFWLLVSTPLAATLLVLAQRGWARLLPLVALVPASAAAIFVLAFSLGLQVQSEAIGLVGFVLVELISPVTALIVGAAALTLVIQDVARWVKGGRHVVTRGA